jgi:hypothetical protein
VLDAALRVKEEPVHHKLRDLQAWLTDRMGSLSENPSDEAPEWKKVLAQAAKALSTEVDNRVRDCISKQERLIEARKEAFQASAELVSVIEHLKEAE